MQERIVVGLDIGTTKVCAVVAAPDEMGRVNILGLGEAPSEGLNRGVVVNIDKTVQAIRKAVNDAAHAAGVQVESVVVGIAGDHIQSFQSRGVVTISSKNGIISPKDVARLLEDTTHVALPTDRRILHVVPQEFIVDGQDGVVDPVGMSGVRLEANVHIISGLVTAARKCSATHVATPPGAPSPEVTVLCCLVPSPEFSQALWSTRPDHLCRFRVRFLCN